jgi:hypothetical protein
VIDSVIGNLAELIQEDRDDALSCLVEESRFKRFVQGVLVFLRILEMHIESL